MSISITQFEQTFKLITECGLLLQTFTSLHSFSSHFMPTITRRGPICSNQFALPLGGSFVINSLTIQFTPYVCGVLVVEFTPFIRLHYLLQSLINLNSVIVEVFVFIYQPINEPTNQLDSSNQFEIREKENYQ